MGGDAYQEALQKALKRLQTSDRFESEVRATLNAYPAETVDAVVAELHRRRYLNDERTTRGVVESNIGKRALGDAALRARLEKRGADDASVEAAMAEAPSEEERIDAILQAKYRPEDSPAKAGRFLFGRGFSEDAISSALSRFFGERETE